MTDDTRLTEEDARTFLELLERVEEEMNEAFEDAAAGVFGNPDESRDDEAFRERWGTKRGSMYTTCTRRKYRTFVESVYFPDEE